MDDFDVIGRWIWLIFILVNLLNTGFFRIKMRRLVQEHPEREPGYRILARSPLLLNIPFLVMGVGFLVGKVPTIFHFFGSSNFRVPERRCKGYDFTTKASLEREFALLAAWRLGVKIQSVLRKDAKPRRKEGTFNVRVPGLDVMTICLPECHNLKANSRRFALRAPPESWGTPISLSIRELCLLNDPRCFRYSIVG